MNQLSVLKFSYYDFIFSHYDDSKYSFTEIAQENSSRYFIAKYLNEYRNNVKRNNNR